MQVVSTVYARIDRTHADALAVHLSEQGFPATVISDGVIDVLFPAAGCLLAPAAELDLWATARGISLDQITIEECCRRASGGGSEVPSSCSSASIRPPA